jgi:hypothetical protein
VIDVTPTSVNLDADDNCTADLYTDGILIMRYLAGYNGDKLTDGALGAGALRTDPAEIAAFLENGSTTMLDVNNNGEADLYTDGILIARYLAGYNGDKLTDGALGTGALRTDPAEIAAFLDKFQPSCVRSEPATPSPLRRQDDPADTAASRPQTDASPVVISRVYTPAADEGLAAFENRPDENPEPLIVVDESAALLLSAVSTSEPGIDTETTATNPLVVEQKVPESTPETFDEPWSSLSDSVFSDVGVVLDAT